MKLKTLIFSSVHLMKKFFSYSPVKTAFEYTQFLLFLGVTSLLNILPLWVIHQIGKGVGFLGYYSIKKFRKTALLNLNFSFPEKSLKEKKNIAKQSFQHIAITVLELLCTKKISKQLDNRIILNPTDLPKKDVIWKRLTEKQGCIFFIGHQANWEIPFTFISRYFHGIALAKKIKNKRIYKKIVSLREKYKGRIYSPSGGIRIAKKKLQQGEFVGLVGDQAVLMSDYSYSFFGKKAWTSNSAALLAYTTNTPVCNIFVKRQKLKNLFSSSELIFPDSTKPFKEEAKRIMDLLMKNLEVNVSQTPEQWMWLHNRWKQKITPLLKKTYRFHTLLIILPSKANLLEVIPTTSALRELYTNADVHLAINSDTTDTINTHINTSQFKKIITYTSTADFKDLLNIYQAVFNFSSLKKINKRFLKTGSFYVFSMEKLMKTKNIYYLVSQKIFHQSQELHKSLINS